MILGNFRSGLAAIFVSALASVQSVQAQESVPISDWEGLYAGGILGVSWTSFDVTSMNQTMTDSSTSVMGGGFLGFNTLLTETILAGVESDIVFSDIGGNFSFSSHRASWVGRLGVLVSPNALLYGLAGLASGNFKAEVTTAGTLANVTTFIEIEDEGVVPVVSTIGVPGVRVEESKRLWGFTVGGGIETEVNIFAQAMRIGAEYRYSNYNEWDLVVAGHLFEIEPEIHELRFRAVIPIN